MIPIQTDSTASNGTRRWALWPFDHRPERVFSFPSRQRVRFVKYQTAMAPLR
jgi:hypothetical protein